MRCVDCYRFTLTSTGTCEICEAIRTDERATERNGIIAYLRSKQATYDTASKLSAGAEKKAFSAMSKAMKNAADELSAEVPRDGYP